MGIRLSKKLGWGLTDVMHDDKGYVSDPRINASALNPPGGEFIAGYLEYLESLKGDEPNISDEWFEVMLTIQMIEESRRREEHIPWPVTRPFEGGCWNVLLVQPVGFDKWSRYDDPIDVAEECASDSGTLGGRVTPMPYGIFPFEGLYMDSRDGRRLDSTAKRMIDRLLDGGPEDAGVSPERHRAAGHLARVLGFEDTDEASRCIAPVVPSDIRNVCSWLDLFTGPDVWLQLRPMLYVYWS